MSTIYLDKLLNPATVAFIGASDREGSLAKAVAHNLLSGGFTGELYLVNPRYKEVLGEPCLKNIQAIDGAIDLAILFIPQRLVKRMLAQLYRRGTRVAVLMSGYKNPNRLHRYAERLGIRLLGPYCAGIIRPHAHLNATFTHNTITPGSLAVVSQSASLGSAILDWSESTNIGFSALLSTGLDTDIGLADLLDLLAEDKQTHAILIYLDRINDARGFLSAISAVARIKPVVLMKSTQDSYRYCDVLNRSGQIYTTDDVFQAAMSRAGVVRIRTFSNLFAAAKLLASKSRIRGKRLAIVSNGAAPAMLGCERIESKGFDLPVLSPALQKKLSATLKTPWSERNPIVLRRSDALGADYQHIVQALQTSGEFDAVLVIFIPNAVNDSVNMAEYVIACYPSPIPLLTCWMGDFSVAAARERLAAASIPTFRTPDAAMDGFDFLHRYFVSQQLLLQLPHATSRHTQADIPSAKKLVTQALLKNERVLGPQKTRALLKHFDIDVLEARRATTLEETESAALRIGYPVALKLVSPNIFHKASVISTQLDIQDAAGLTSAYSMIQARAAEIRPDAEVRGVLVEAMYKAENSRSLSVSITRDPTFGPVMAIGIGDDLGTLLYHKAVQLPPLNQFLIDTLLAQRDLRTYLGALRHLPAVDTGALSHLLRQLSELACELPEVYSIHINPLSVSSERAVAIEAQVVLEKNHSRRRYGHLSIHPYPWQWIRKVTLKQNREVTVRPIRPEDGESIRALVQRMSAESRYYRFMHAINELSPQMVAQFTKLDYDRQMAFVAVAESPAGESLIAGVSRYAMSTDQLTGEFAISVADEWQGLGLATTLMRQLIEHAKSHNLLHLQGDVLRNNHAMHRLMSTLGFKARHSQEDADVLIYSFELQTDTV